MIGRGVHHSLDGAPMRWALSTVHGVVIPRASGIHVEQRSTRDLELHCFKEAKITQVVPWELFSKSSSFSSIYC